MSRTKDFMPDGAHYEMVKGYLFQIGAIENCPYHGNILIDCCLNEDVLYAKVTSAYKKDYGGDLPVSYSDFREIVQDIMKNTSYECPECQHEME